MNSRRNIKKWFNSSKKDTPNRRSSLPIQNMVFHFYFIPSENLWNNEMTSQTILLDFMMQFQNVVYDGHQKNILRKHSLSHAAETFGNPGLPSCKQRYPPPGWGGSHAAGSPPLWISFSPLLLAVSQNIWTHLTVRSDFSRDLCSGGL